MAKPGNGARGMWSSTGDGEELDSKLRCPQTRVTGCPGILGRGGSFRMAVEVVLGDLWEVLPGRFAKQSREANTPGQMLDEDTALQSLFPADLGL